MPSDNTRTKARIVLSFFLWFIGGWRSFFTDGFGSRRLGSVCRTTVGRGRFFSFFRSLRERGSLEGSRLGRIGFDVGIGFRL